MFSHQNHVLVSIDNSWIEANNGIEHISKIDTFIEIPGFQLTVIEKKGRRLKAL